MSVGQRRQLHRVAPPVNELIAELTPRIIEPSREKQKALSVAEVTILFRVGAHRVITVYPVDRDTWNTKEFDSESGELVLLRDETAKIADDAVPPWVLAATITSIEDQLAAYASDGFSTPAHEESAATITRQLAVLRQRQITAAGTGQISSVDDTDDDYFG